METNLKMVIELKLTPAAFQKCRAAAAAQGLTLQEFINRTFEHFESIPTQS